MIFHKRYLIPVWSSRVVSAVITFIITIPMLSNNPPCSKTSSEAIFSLHFRHQSPDLYAFVGIVVFSRPRNPEKWFWFLTNLPTSIYLEYVVISCYCSGTGCIKGWKMLVCLWFLSFGIVCLWQFNTKAYVWELISLSLQGSIILIIFTIIRLIIIIIITIVMSGQKIDLFQPPG